ncbi:hypothetical protein BESB_066540 [Besnoitia besnoiti]|uniref:Leucyl/phenylalanyl-tRNA protein transferase n=1 Tax=Besnoitia besnoiti TaxID=94643 RepID=A0A2A9MEC4_BESBE|nr:hypothetical protein BESB_066540 [Besnoitia besnoiti]PFH34621.1 hypothetical protein BESB_066540 [Besnoitia besnoiti]
MYDIGRRTYPPPPCVWRPPPVLREKEAEKASLSRDHGVDRAREAAAADKMPRRNPRGTRAEGDSEPFYELSPADLHALCRERPSLRSLPRLTADYDLEEVASRVTAIQFPCDFLWASLISPSFYARLLHAAFLPIGHRVKLRRGERATHPAKRGKTADRGENGDETTELRDASKRESERADTQEEGQGSCDRRAGEPPAEPTTGGDRGQTAAPPGQEAKAAHAKGAKTEETGEEASDLETEKASDDASDEDGRDVEMSESEDGDRSEEEDTKHHGTDGPGTATSPSDATCARRVLYLLLPKLHQERCCLRLDRMTLHISRNTRKRAKRFFFSIDRDIDGVLQGCVRQHGEGWLYPPVRAALKALHAQQLRRGAGEACGSSEGEARKTRGPESARGGLRVPGREDDEVFLHSIEVWTREDDSHGNGGKPDRHSKSNEAGRHVSRTATGSAPRTEGSASSSDSSSSSSSSCPSASSAGLSSSSTGHVLRPQCPASASSASCPPTSSGRRWRLCGGEIGVRVGAVYTSLTGFSSVSEAGNVQLAALGVLLKLAGVRLWDMGMELDYKLSLGAQTLSRADFLGLFREARALPASPLTTQAAHRLLRQAAADGDGGREACGGSEAAELPGEAGGGTGMKKQAGQARRGFASSGGGGSHEAAPSRAADADCARSEASLASPSAAAASSLASPSSSRSAAPRKGGLARDEARRLEERGGGQAAEEWLNCDWFIDVYRVEQERRERVQGEPDGALTSTSRKQRKQERGATRKEATSMHLPSASQL